jgi:hypothetical protein
VIAFQLVSLFVISHNYIVALLFNGLINESVDFMSIGPEYIVLGTGEVSVYLARKESVFRYVGSARVFFKRKNEQPCDADYNAEGRKIGRELENAGIFAQREERSFAC